MPSPTHPDTPPVPDDLDSRHLTASVTTLLQRLEWLSPPDTLPDVSGAAFGRHIAQHLRDLKDQRNAVSIKLWQQPMAVVMGIDQYEELLQMKEACNALLRAQRRQDLEALGDEFARLYQIMQRPEHKVATDALFAASADDLNATFRPGDTETSA